MSGKVSGGFNSEILINKENGTLASISCFVEHQLQDVILLATLFKSPPLSSHYRCARVILRHALVYIATLSALIVSLLILIVCDVVSPSYSLIGEG